ncbi:MAG: hypothetical protein GQ582_06445 [Methyloprofundus sp.]|nr:hypothetical protein [Methyloprofundus sp.]
MDKEYAAWLHVKNTINTATKDKVNLLVIGDSRSKAGFIPNEVKGFTSINLSLGGASAVEGYYTLEKYLQNNPAPDHLLLSYVPYHLEDWSSYWNRAVSYNFLNDKDYQEIENKAKEFKEISILRRKRSYWYYKNPINYRSNFRNGFFNLRWGRNMQVFRDSIADRGHYFYGTRNSSNKLNKDTKQQDFEISRFQNYYLRKLLDLAEKSEIKLYFFNMPFNKASFDQVKPLYVTHFTDYVNQLSSDYELKICNKINFMENNNFGDSSHLYKGARKNTKNVMHCLAL